MPTIQSATNSVDQERIANAVREMLQAIGQDPQREGLMDTPDRVARMYAEIFAGLREDPLEPLLTGFEEGFDEMVVARDIPFHSMCEHHLLPFQGVAHIGYIPGKRIVGISKLARVTEILSRRPQLQERLTTQIAEAIVTALEPKGVGVVIEAEHLCMSMRGIRKPGTQIVTSVNRGIFRSDPRTRTEFLGFVRNR